MKGRASAAERRPSVERPSVLILHEKHGNRYLLANSDQELHRAALAVLKARMEAGYFYREPEPPEDPGLTKEQVEALPASIRETAKKKLAQYLGDLRYYRDEKKLFEETQRALKEGDGRAAWEILRDRSDHEYERVELVRFEDPEELSA